VGNGKENESVFVLSQNGFNMGLAHLKNIGLDSGMSCQQNLKKEVAGLLV
jgi:hypothetical protein